MPITLYNTLTKTIEPFTPLNPERVTIYTCGPTVYDHVHIGNLSAYIYSDTLRRMIMANNYPVRHVMNFTDVDDKTINRSRERYPELDSMEALKKLTGEYSDVFLSDARTIGNDIAAITFIRAADDATIEAMRQLITELVTKEFAYIADDGIYFSLNAYKKSGKTYGQLVELTEENTSSERISNDEYDKDSVHDFALWKIQKEGEPAWPFPLGGRDLTGRPGWHIECSAMSRLELGQPIDIHTGGIDNAFPHHENEIAQSTAGRDNPVYAQFFVHNEHLLVEGEKMAKSKQNFYTLSDLIEHGVEPLAFRLLVLQSHYRKATNFSFDNADAARNRLQHWRNVAALRHQAHDALGYEAEKEADSLVPVSATKEAIVETLSADLNTPEVLKLIDETFDRIESTPLPNVRHGYLNQLIDVIDEILGLQLKSSTPDITDRQKQIIDERQKARAANDWATSDKLRGELMSEGIAIRDTENGPIWQYA